MKKQTYYFTFMQSQYALKDYWIEVIASSENDARQAMTEHFGLKWFTSYDSRSFTQSYFTKGCLLSFTAQEGGSVEED